jgi:uncharacterized flavoprotein (TIGR03862 family)
LKSDQTTAVIGGGPAGLFASWLLLKEGGSVDLYERNNHPGLKLLLAGKSGLNITSRHDPDKFHTLYGKRADFFHGALKDFSSQDLINWLHDMGEDTFTGSGEKVFPMNSNTREIRDKWISQMEKSGRFHFYGGHELVNWQNNELVFKREDSLKRITPATVLFALGGGSWPETGSDGAWIPIFEQRGISLVPLKPLNCAFKIDWSPFLIEKYKDSPLKNIRVNYSGESKRGDLLIRDLGIEGGPLYHFSRDLVEEINLKGKSRIKIDLTPDLSMEKVISRLEKGRGKKSYSSFLKKELHLSPLKIALLYEGERNLPPSDLLARKIKGLPLELTGTDKLERAISTMGGVDFSALDEKLMLKDYPGFFIAGEMADWDSPTGGFLLQGCFTTAFRAVKGIINYHEKNT